MPRLGRFRTAIRLLTGPGVTRYGRIVKKTMYCAHDGRLVHAYRANAQPAAGKFAELQLHSPLDGWPRKLTSGMGDRRANGRRRHRGVDFDSQTGEPVRAVADGVVILAGVDMKVGPGKSMPSYRARRVRFSRMGPGGLLVVVRHANGLDSAYMHLSSYRVRRGQRVQAGELLGYVGRTGIRHSPAHLHFELRYAGRHLKPRTLPWQDGFRADGDLRR